LVEDSVQRSKLWRLLGITLVNALLFFSSQFHGTALPVYLYMLSGSNAAVGICMALGTLAALIMRPLTGIAVDRIGRGAVLFTGALMSGLIFLAYAVFPSVSAVILIRFLYGFAWGMATTASNTIAADLAPRDRFGEWMGYFTLSQSFSMAVAPAVALSIMDSQGFPALMLIAAGIASVVVALSFFYWQKGAAKSARHSFRLYEKSALRPAFLMLLVGIGLGATFSFVVLFGRSLKFPHVNAYFTYFAVTLFIGRPVIGRVIDRYGFRAVLVFGFLGFAISLAMLWQTQNELMFLSAAALQGVAYGALQNSLQTMSVISALPERRGAANATYFSGFDAGIGIGSLLAGVVAKSSGYANMFGVSTLPLLIGVVLYLLTERHAG